MLGDDLPESIGLIICMQGIQNFDTYDLEDVGLEDLGI